MTARRRRKSGSGPSATALIAWVGGARPDVTDGDATPTSVAGSAPTARTVGGRAILLGRACGLAAGTLLACGSVLVGATHAGDGSLATDTAPLLNPLPAEPGATVETPGDFETETPSEPGPAAPEPVRAQAVAAQSPVVGPRSGRVRRNAPVSVEMPAGVHQHPDTAPQPGGHPAPSGADRAPAAPVAPISPVLDPATNGVGEVAPVGGVLRPGKPSPQRADNQFGPASDEQPADQHAKPVNNVPQSPVRTLDKVVAPLDNTINPVLEPVATQPLTQAVTQQPPIQPVTQPAMAMLSSLLPLG
jgi:hypothetical protein